MAQPQAGDRINNYLLETVVGTGSFGQVWRAHHHVLDQVVAIKVPTDLQYVRNLQREGVAIHGLKHANIVRALDLDPYGDPPYLIMEYVDGPSLRGVLDVNPRGLPVPAVVEILHGVLAALEVAHQAGLIHRDVKPANVLLNHPLERVQEVRRDAVRVTDFGLGQASGVTTASIMQSGSMLTEEGKSISGTLAYMSPEQKEGKDVDARSDLYSCGIVLYELLTGERPCGTDVPSTLRSEVPAFLDDVFRRSYTRLERRYPTAAAMRQALGAGAEGTVLPPLPPFAGLPPLPVADGSSVCPACNGLVGEGEQFCIHCGQQLVAIVPRCPSCHGYVQREDRYCIFCGTRLPTSVA